MVTLIAQRKVGSITRIFASGKGHWDDRARSHGPEAPSWRAYPVFRAPTCLPENKTDCMAQKSSSSELLDAIVIPRWGGQT